MKMSPVELKVYNALLIEVLEANPSNKLNRILHLKDYIGAINSLWYRLEYIEDFENEDEGLHPEDFGNEFR